MSVFQAENMTPLHVQRTLQADVEKRRLTLLNSVRSLSDTVVIECTKVAKGLVNDADVPLHFRDQLVDKIDRQTQSALELTKNYLTQEFADQKKISRQPVRNLLNQLISPSSKANGFSSEVKHFNDRLAKVPLVVSGKDSSAQPTTTAKSSRFSALFSLGSRSLDKTTKSSSKAFKVPEQLPTPEQVTAHFKSQIIDPILAALKRDAVQSIMGITEFTRQYCITIIRNGFETYGDLQSPEFKRAQAAASSGSTCSTSASPTSLGPLSPTQDGETVPIEEVIALAMYANCVAIQGAFDALREIAEPYKHGLV